MKTVGNKERRRLEGRPQHRGVCPTSRELSRILRSVGRRRWSPVTPPAVSGRPVGRYRRVRDSTAPKTPEAAFEGDPSAAGWSGGHPGRDAGRRTNAGPPQGQRRRIGNRREDSATWTGEECVCQERQLPTHIPEAQRPRTTAGHFSRYLATLMDVREWS